MKVKNETALSQRFQVAKVIGKSMRPLLHQGDQVIIDTKYDRKKLKRGDLVAFGRHQDHLAIHRIVRIDHQTIQTKGDNSVFLDQPMSRRQVRGKIILVRTNKKDIIQLTDCKKSTFLGMAFEITLYMAARLRFRLSYITKDWLLRLSNAEIVSSNNSRNAHQKMRYESQTLGNELVIFDHQTGNLHSLNETAATIWKLSQKGKSTDQIIDHLINDYENLTRETAEKDVQTLLQQLKAKELIHS